jgi:hypothetical protein
MDDGGDKGTDGDEKEEEEDDGDDAVTLLPDDRTIGDDDTANDDDDEEVTAIGDNPRRGRGLALLDDPSCRLVVLFSGVVVAEVVGAVVVAMVEEVNKSLFLPGEDDIGNRFRPRCCCCCCVCGGMMVKGFYSV